LNKTETINIKNRAAVCSDLLLVSKQFWDEKGRERFIGSVVNQGKEE
jgi:hypothetical protein